MIRWPETALHVCVMTVGLTGLACAQPAPPAQAAGQSAGPSAVAARIGDRAITVEEIDRKWQELDAASFMKATQERYDVRRRVLDTLIGDHLIAEEAKRRGTPADRLLADELAKRVREVTETDLQTAYEQMRGQMNGAALEQVRVPLMQYLVQQRRNEAREGLVEELRAKAGAIEIALDPPRYTVSSAAHDPVRGPAGAPVEIVEFSDFQCPFCGRVAPTLNRVRETFGDQVKFVFRDFPLTSIHPQAHQAAEAAECASEQGKFWEYHDVLFANQRALGTSDLKRHATTIGLDAEAFAGCLDSGRTRPRVEADLAAAQALGLQATPAFFINGRFLSGAQPFEAFERIIREELARKGLK